MLIPQKSIAVKKVEMMYSCLLTTIPRKHIMFHGITNGKEIVLCTPQSRMHAQGHGWFDLSLEQVDLLDRAEIAMLAVRLEGNKVYYVDFKQLRKLMTADMMLNYSEVMKWRFYIWEDYIKVRGNEQKFLVKPEVVEVLDIEEM